MPARCRDGSRPVKIVATEGRVHGDVPNAWSKTAAPSAHTSRCGLVGRSVVAVDAQMIRTQRIDDDQHDRTRGVSLTTGRGQYQPKAQSERARAQQRWHPPTVLPKIAERPKTLELLLGQRALLAREGPVPGLGKPGAEQSAEMRGGLNVACGKILPLLRILVEIV